MADVTINGLSNELTTPGPNDLIGIWNLVTSRYEKIKRSNLIGASITGGGTLALGGFTLTVPASGTAALMGVANAGAFVFNRGALVIAADAVNASGISYATVDTEALVAADDLATINGGVSGQILILQTLANTRDVTVKHGTGNIWLDGLVDFTLTATRDKIMLISIGTEWHEIGRGNNT